MNNETAIQKNDSNAAVQENMIRKVFVPAVDIYETKDNVVVLADMPGVDESGVDLTLESGELTIKGTSRIHLPAEHRLAYAEYAVGDYRRTFTLASDEIDQENIKATMKNGVLKLVLPKTETVKSKKIEVKAG
jgi:HSP20 family protein